MFKKVLLGLAALVAVVLVAGGGYVAASASAFDRSMAKVYDVPVPAIARTADPAALVRGKHLMESLGSCNNADCHGTDLGGGRTLAFGPIGSITGPNISSAGKLGAYSDGELARLLQHGVKRDGHSVSFMPSQDFAWWPEEDVVALVSFLRTMPPVQRPDGQSRLTLMAKVLDRHDAIPIDVARRIDHERRETAPAPAPTAAYGRYMAKLCQGCHGAGLAGGPLPGAPSSMAVPLNLTPHETGLKDWSYEDFDRLLTKGIRKNGAPLKPGAMPYEALAHMSEIEKRALWAHLRGMAPMAFGKR